MILSKEQRMEIATAAHEAGQQAFDWQDFNRKQIQQMALDELHNTKWAHLAEFEQIRLIWKVNFYWGFRFSEVGNSMTDPSIYERKLVCFLPGAEMIEATDWYRDEE
jgi:hypothetical protein